MAHRTVTEIQDRTLGEFNRILHNAKYSDNARPTVEVSKPTVRPAAPERISFYVPSNPLNGFNGKSKQEQSDLKRKMRQVEKERKSSK